MHKDNRRPPFALVVTVSLLLWHARADAQNATAGGTVALANRDAAAIRAELDTMAAGWNRGDLAVYLSGYADSVATQGSGGFVVGIPAAEKVMRGGYWKTGRPAQTLHLEHLVERGLSSDVVLATGEYVLSGGGEPDHTGWFATVWRRTAAGWRCVLDHSSS